VLSDEKREALLVEVHRAIEQAATQAAEAIAGVRPVPAFGYPPNGGLNDAEASLLRAGARGAEAVPALRKVIADAASVPLFRLFTLIDAVGDPDDWEGDWLPLQLREAPEDEDQPMLHDELFESYWTWVERRGDPGWRLDSAGSP
jgi:hypothetical protein